MPCRDSSTSSTRQFVRSYERWDSCKRRYVKINVYRKAPKAKTLSDLRPGDRHPTTGTRIPSPNDKSAQYPGNGFCRTVCVKRVKKYRVDRYGRRTLISNNVVSRRPVTGWHVCKGRGNTPCR